MRHHDELLTAGIEHGKYRPFLHAVAVVVITRPSPRDGGMIQTHYGTPVMYRRARER